MLKVWGRNNSVNVQKVMWCVAELGLAHERIEAGGRFGKNDEDWYRAMDPNGRVPVVDDDGFTLWESNAIVRYLSARYGLGSLCPKTERSRADADRWMDWATTTLLPPIGICFWNLIRTPETERDMAAVEAAARQAGEIYEVLDRHLAERQTMLGKALTMADIPVGCLTYRWYGLPLAHAERPNVRAWYERLSERPAFRDQVMIPLT